MCHCLNFYNTAKYLIRKPISYKNFMFSSYFVVVNSNISNIKNSWSLRNTFAWKNALNFSTTPIYRRKHKTYHSQRYTRSSDKSHQLFEEEEKENREEINAILEDEDYEHFVRKSGGNLLGFSSVAVLQPWVKWGSKKKRYTSPDFLLDEACALVKSLPNMTVAYKEYISLQKISKAYVFGSGNLERLASEIRISSAQAIFVSMDSLSRIQRSKLEEYFQMKVFDRYIVVLAIFKFYASTTEAKLQIAMAELPCMSKNVLTEKDRLVLHRREANLKMELKRLSTRRSTVRESRKKSSLPSIAIVGYTNCGKTTLIQALTGDERARGEDRLFATLDVTAHRGRIPCGINVIYLDSVGFIQDIPTGLIASFQATLQDAIDADLIIHIRDISHPDIVAQTKSVKETLSSLLMPETSPVLLVNNKTDLLEQKLRSSTASEDVKQDDPVYKEGIYISAVSGTGISQMLQKVQSELLRVTGRKMYVMKLQTGSPKIDWLKNSIGISSEEVDQESPNFTRVYVVMSEAEKAAFRRAFQDLMIN